MSDQKQDDVHELYLKLDAANARTHAAMVELKDAHSALLDCQARNTELTQELEAARTRGDDHLQKKTVLLGDFKELEEKLAETESSKDQYWQWYQREQGQVQQFQGVLDGLGIPREQKSNESGSCSTTPLSPVARVAMFLNTLIK